MKRTKESEVYMVGLPWSSGCLSAKLWKVGNRTVVGVPELGLHCYGRSQPEAVFRLFTSLLKYYRQLKAFKTQLPQKALQHLELLTIWVSAIEKKMKVQTDESHFGNVVTIVPRR
jgi:hypothetical protein